MVLLRASPKRGAQQQTELRIGYQPNPIEDASIAMMEKWGAKNNVKIIKVPNCLRRVCREDDRRADRRHSDQFDVIWHNDDWGQTCGRILLEPTDDIAGMKYRRCKWGMAPDHLGQRTGWQSRPRCRWATLSACFSIALISLKEDEAAQDAGADLVTVSKKLQADEKGEVRLCRRHVDEQQLVHLVLERCWTNYCDVFCCRPTSVTQQ